MRILIFDPLQHFPASQRILTEGVNPKAEIVYLSYFTQEGVWPNQLYRNINQFRKTYNFTPCDAENPQLSNIDFDVIFFVFPAFLDWPDLARNQQDILLFKKCMAVIEPLRKTCTRLVLIDNHDYPHDPMENPVVSTYSFDLVLKREKLTTRTYASKVVPFPFVVFGMNDPIVTFLTRTSFVNPFRSNRAYWAGTAFVHDDLSSGLYVNRESVVQELASLDSGNFNILRTNVSNARYVRNMKNHHFALNLVGVGQLTKRFFESLSYGAIPLMQSNSLEFPSELSAQSVVLKELEWGNVTELCDILDTFRKPSKRRKMHQSVNRFADTLDSKFLAHLMLKDL